MDRQDVFNRLVEMLKGTGIEIKEGGKYAIAQCGKSCFSITNDTSRDEIRAIFVIDDRPWEYYALLRPIIYNKQEGLLYDLNKLPNALITVYGALIKLEKAKRELQLCVKKS